MFQLTVEARRDIQGLITSGYVHLPYTAYLFLEMSSEVGARRWLSAILPQISTSESWRRTPSEPKAKPHQALNVAFTFDGYRRLGLSNAALNSFSREFQLGMVQRAEVLGDIGPSAPDKWDFGYPQNGLHGILMVFGSDKGALLEWLDRQQQQIRDSGGVAIIANEQGHRFTPPLEHFGFRDGISQPQVEGIRKETRRGEPLIRTGEFILGYPDAYDCLPPTVGVPRAEDAADVLPRFPGQPEWKDFGRHGSYLVFRKIEQDVAGFWQFIQRIVEHTPGVPFPQEPDRKEEVMKHLASKFVGRWPSGAPLVLAPTHDDPALGGDPERNNDFLFMEKDPHGFGCPFAAHVRRANPRDSLARDTAELSMKTTNRHRLVRRGIPYGERLITDKVLDVRDDGKRRGLHFIALSSSIKRQFEFIQQQWLNNTRFNGLFNDKDPLVSNNDGTGNMTIDREIGRETIRHVPAFVTTKGGGYFFAPSITALRFLAGSG
jgi:Dyp-type peroxidase family